MAENKELQQKVDHTALIVQMTTAANLAAHRWDEVARIYTEAWDSAFTTHLDVIGKVRAQKEARAKAALDRIKLCLELASVFLPMVGGPAAVAMAPILTARARLFVGTMEKKAQNMWKSYAAEEPIASKVLAEVGKRSLAEGKSAVEKVQKDIIEKLAPKYQEAKAPPANTTPVKAFKDNNALTRDAMNVWLNDVAQWNVAGGWQRMLIPAAHALFLKHPWIRLAPTVEATQAMLKDLTRYIEMAVWFRWARTLNEAYWQKVQDWYYKDYSVKNLNDRRQMVENRARHMVIDALDYRPLIIHFGYNFRRQEGVRQWTIEDPSA
ncbi:MAG: hypothetical protein JNK48_29105, partial [Bryobacterales bacterium]|nr:hypothetical protein [Bryobacterales bacterium]